MALKLRLPSFPLHPHGLPARLQLDHRCHAAGHHHHLGRSRRCCCATAACARTSKALPFFLGLIVGTASVGLIGTVLSHALLGV